MVVDFFIILLQRVTKNEDLFCLGGKLQERCQLLQNILRLIRVNDPEGAAAGASCKVVAGGQELITNMDCGIWCGSKIVLKNLNTNQLVTTIKKEGIVRNKVSTQKSIS